MICASVHRNGDRCSRSRGRRERTRITSLTASPYRSRLFRSFIRLLLC